MNTLIYGINTEAFCLLKGKLRTESVFGILSNPAKEDKGCISNGYLYFMQFAMEGWDSSICSEEEFLSISEKAQTILNCYSRHFSYKGLNKPTFQDYMAILRSHYIRCAKIVNKINPSLAIFMNVPHEGFDNVLYQVLLGRGVKVFICFQIPCAPKHLLLPGRESLELIFEGSRDPLVSPQGKRDMDYVSQFMNKLLGNDEYFYMKEITQATVQRSFGTKFAFFGRRASSTIGKLGLVVPRIRPELLEAFSAKREARRYSKNYRLTSKRWNASKDVPDRIIYFPLHLQPEMTTSALGDVYSDQTIAISKARELARQADCTLICKENPKQQFIERSDYFFKTLDKLGDVLIAPKEVDSRTLIRRAQAVVTITGTAGLEALAYGRPVWCLSKGAWWRNYPGVCHSMEDTLQAIKNPGHNCSPNKLADSLLNTIAYSLAGCSDIDYAESFGLSQSENSARLADSLALKIKGFYQSCREATFQ